AHEAADLLGRAAPVAGGEGEEREGGDAVPVRGLDDPADRLDASAVTGAAGLTTQGRPTAAAVTADGDVEGRAHRVARPGRGLAFAASAASRTSCSSTARYST